MAMQSQTEDLGEMALKEKSIFPGNCPKTAKEQDPLGSKIYWRNLKKKHKFHPL